MGGNAVYPRPLRNPYGYTAGAEVRIAPGSGRSGSRAECRVSGLVSRTAPLGPAEATFAMHSGSLLNWLAIACDYRRRGGHMVTTGWVRVTVART